MNRFPPAESDFERKIGAHALGELGRAHLGRNRLQDAVYYLRKASDLDPTSWRVFNNLGVALFKMGHPEQAIKCYREALRYDPNNPGIKENLKKALGQIQE